MRNVLGLSFAMIGWLFVWLGMLVMKEDMRNKYAVKVIDSLGAL